MTRGSSTIMRSMGAKHGHAFPQSIYLGPSPFHVVLVDFANITREHYARRRPRTWESPRQFWRPPRCDQMRSWERAETDTALWPKQIVSIKLSTRLIWLAEKIDARVQISVAHSTTPVKRCSLYVHKSRGSPDINPCNFAPGLRTWSRENSVYRASAMFYGDGHARLPPHGFTRTLPTR